MTTLKINTTFGNFKVVGHTEVDEEVLDVLAEAGALQVLQRSPATAAEKELAGYDKKRPEGFKRTDIPFSAANAAVLEKHLSKVKVVGDSTTDAEGKEVAGKEYVLDFLLEIAEHVPNSGAEPKFKAEKDFVKLYLSSNGGKLSTGAARTVESFAGNRGIEVGADTAAWEDDGEFLARVREWKKAEDAKAGAKE